MLTDLKMPALSPTMEKGTIARWLVNEGDLVQPGDIIAEIETDKATMELEAEAASRIDRILIAAGSDDVAVGTVIALLSAGQDRMPAVRLPETASAETPGEERHVPAPAPAAQPAAQAVIEQEAPRSHRQRPADRIGVSPLALRIAEAKGIDLAAITGTGPNGRIVRADLGIVAQPRPEAHMPAFQPVPVPATGAAPSLEPLPAGVPVETVKLSSMRRTIARRLSQSKQSVPHFYLTARCNIDLLLRLRTEINAGLIERGSRISVNDMLMKAMAMALEDVPDANVQFGGDELHRFQQVDIAMAVAIDGGLITPVIRDVDRLSLSAIASTSKTLAARARDGKLALEDYQGGTASISNLGMFGIDEMIPVINPPQALILGVGAGIERPWKVGGDIALATIIAATASFDHRAIDGAAAARFMAALRDLVESPLRIIS